MPEVHELAALEVAEAALYYDERRLGLGDRLLEEVEVAYRRIDEFPLAGSPWDQPELLGQDLRRVPLSSFPYLLIYETKPSLRVLAFSHVRREPDYWTGRLKGDYRA